MKKEKLVIACLLGLIVFGLSACRYPEPSPSIHTPEYRIIGSWKVHSTYFNGTPLDSTNINVLDSTGLYANNPGTYYYIYADHILNVMAYHNGDFRQSTFSTWVLLNKNTQLALDFTILGRRYSYTADITKLTRKELNYEYDDEDGNHWRLELQSASVF